MSEIKINNNVSTISTFIFKPKRGSYERFKNEHIEDGEIAFVYDLDGNGDRCNASLYMGNGDDYVGRGLKPLIKDSTKDIEKIKSELYEMECDYESKMENLRYEIVCLKRFNIAMMILILGLIIVTTLLCVF